MRRALGEDGLDVDFSGRIEAVLLGHMRDVELARRKPKVTSVPGLTIVAHMLSTIE
jgi:hypothetical protein